MFYDSYISLDTIQNIFKNNENLKKFINFLKNDKKYNLYGNLSIILGNKIFYNTIDNFFLTSLFTMFLLKNIDHSMYLYINGNNIVYYIENFLNKFGNISENDKINYNFSGDFGKKIPNIYKNFISIYFIKNLFNEKFFDKIYDLYNNKKSKSNILNIDLIDMLGITLELISGESLSRSEIKKLFIGNKFLNIFKKLDKNFNNIIKGFPSLNFFNHEGHNSFIVDLDIKSALKNTQNLFGIWDEEIINNAYKILNLGYTRKSEYIFDKIKRNKNVYNENEKKILLDYLSDTEIYEYDDYVLFEYDGINEILTMGIGPQASCQNILLDTGYNKPIVGNAIEIPYTKLIMGFTKPKGFKGIDFNTKEVIIIENGKEIKKPLYIENRMLMVLGDTDRSKGVILQRNYGKDIGGDNMDNLLKRIQNKYNKIGKIISKKFKEEKEYYENNYRDYWIYEEGED